MLHAMRFFRTAVLGAAAAGAWGVAEARAYRLQEHRITVRDTVPPLRILHLSDAHLTGRDHRRVRFIRSLPERIGTVDLILMTGDMLEGDDGIGPLLDALTPLQARLAKAYVLGSHDYYQSRFRLPSKYLIRREASPDTTPADTQRMVNGLKEQNWFDLTNRSEIVETDFGKIRLTGVDDPYLRRHRTDHISRGDEVLAVGLAHAPDVVSTYALAGYDLVLAGHTHGGQLRLPFLGAMVTNSPLPAALAAGPRTVGSTTLHVSPGLGTSRYMRIRFLCRPEATVLHLEPR